MNRDLCGGGPPAERPLRGGPSVLRRTVSGWRHSKRVPLRRCGSAAVRAFDARRKRMLSRRIFAASSMVGQTEHTFYRFRVCSQVGKMGVFLLYFSYFSPTPYAAARRRASVVLRRRGNLITGNAAMRRCPFGGERVGAKTAFWMARALCFVVRLKNGWRKDIPPDGLRRIAAQAVRGDNASKKRIHNRTKMICFIRYNEV